MAVGETREEIGISEGSWVCEERHDDGEYVQVDVGGGNKGRIECETWVRLTCGL